MEQRQNLVIHSVLACYTNGLTEFIDFRTDFAPDIVSRIERCSYALELSTIFKHLLDSPNNNIYVSFLIYFNYVADEPSTRRHIMVSSRSWTAVIVKDFTEQA